MKKLAMQSAAMVGAYLMLSLVFDAPAWGAIIGGWVFWLAARPEGW